MNEDTEQKAKTVIAVGVVLMLIIIALILLVKFFGYAVAAIAGAVTWHHRAAIDEKWVAFVQKGKNNAPASTGAANDQ